jgi:hypothetical protein
MTTGSSCPVDYATQLAFQEYWISRKPIKNMELGGSADTCIGTTYGEPNAFRKGRKYRKARFDARQRLITYRLETA